MTKIRQPDTTEEALLIACAHIGKKRLAHALGYSESMLVRWSDPDDDARRIYFDVACEVDDICVRDGHDAPFYGLQRRRLAEVEHGHVAGCPVDRMGAMAKEFGEAASAYAAASRDDFDMAGAMDAARELLEAIEVLTKARNDILVRVRANQMVIPLHKEAAE